MNIDVDVVVVGAGPTGLLLSGDLARTGVSGAVLERRAGQSNLTRAFAVHAPHAPCSQPRCVPVRPHLSRR